MRLTRDIAPEVRRPVAPGHWRLLAPALLAWGAVALLLPRPGLAGWAAGCTLGVGLLLGGGTVLSGVSHRRGCGWTNVAWRLLAVLCAVLLLVSVRTVTLQESRGASPLVDDAAAHRAVTLEVTLTGFPGLTVGVTGERGWVTARSGRPAVPVLLWLDERAPPEWAPGTRLTVRGVPRAMEPSDSAAFGIGVHEVAAVGGDEGTTRAGAAKLRAGLRDAARSTPGAELVPGLAVGDTSLVSPELDDVMRDSSLAHLTAVSGANCALVIGALVAIAARFGAGRRLRLVLAALGLGAFIAVVGPDPSVLRAAVMAVVVLVSRFGGLPEAGLPALGVAIVVLLAHDPWQALQAGFALSVAATGGILLLAGPLTRAARALWLPRPLAVAVAVAAAAQFACGPFLLLLQPGLPAIGVAANVIAGPAAPLGTGLGLAAALAAPISPTLASAFVWLAAWPARWIAGVAELAAGLPLARWVWPDGWSGAILLASAQLAAVLAGLIWFGRVRLPWLPSPVPRQRWQLAPAKPGAVRTASAVLAACAAGILVATSLVTPLAQRAGVPRDWAIVMCDVGQGDAILLRDPEAPNQVMLVDTGDDPALLGTCLDRFGVGRIALLVLTHDHQDHVGALGEVIGRVDRALIAPATTEAGGREVVRRLEAAGVPFSVGAAGDASGLGPGVRWKMLAPAPGARPSSANAASLMLVAEPGGLSVLLLGDSGQAEQAALLREHSDLSVDVLKVGHHGSRDREPGLAAEVDARLALVSVGAENRYGHPNSQVTAELARAGIALLRTDEHGSLAVTLEGLGSPGVWVERAEPSVSGRR